jgi:hypothetical protein
VGTKLIGSDAFLAAFIFQNAQLDDQTLPKILSYKIRMNSSFTHNTIFTQDRFYNYNPSNCLGCNTYFTYGFIYLQDLLEAAVIEMKTNRSHHLILFSFCVTNAFCVSYLSYCFCLFFVLIP